MYGTGTIKKHGEVYVVSSNDVEEINGIRGATFGQTIAQVGEHSDSLVQWSDPITMHGVAVEWDLTLWR
jgi:hypothetical protein